MDQDGRGVSMGVDVVIDSDITLHPSCPHGPTLLFEKFSANSKKNGRQFYACSANRDRRQCKFFLWAEEFKKSKIYHVEKEKQVHTREEFVRRLENIVKQPEIKFCRPCCLLLLSKEWKTHIKHGFIETLDPKILANPSSLLLPKQQNTSHAQYYFSARTVNFIVGSICKFGFEKVLCIGAPKIHEKIVNSNDLGLQSLLLDIDNRFAQFYNQDQFCHYNLFNHHFFDEPENEKNLVKFLTGKEKVVLVLDPPFGGLIDVLANTLMKINTLHQNANCSADNINEIGVLLVFPYFNEERIIQSIPTLKMMDYKVDYENHSSFHSKGRKQGSPVRIFTNLNSANFILPAEEGYKFCELCQRFVSEENEHCSKCQACTSKDGRAYKHCEICNICVKSSRIHCQICNHCNLPDHQCGEVKKIGACHRCGEVGHKRKDCTSQQKGKNIKDGGSSQQRGIKRKKGHSSQQKQRKR